MSKEAVKLEVKMPLSDVLVLNQELQQMNREKEISFVVKYKLVKLLEKTQSLVKKFNETKLELFKKYGKEDKKIKGNFSLNDATPANYKKGMDELTKLIEVEEIFTEFAFDIKDFENVKSEVGYFQIFKFMNT